MSKNRCSTNCECGLDFRLRPEVGVRPEETLMTIYAYLELMGRENYPYRDRMDRGRNGGKGLYGKIICPLCRLEYLGYFEPTFDNEGWIVYDTSFWSSFNDEPAEADQRNWRDPVEALKSLNA